MGLHPDLSLAMLQGPSLPMLQASSLSKLQGPLLNQLQVLAIMNNQPRLMRPLAQNQYQHHKMMTLLQWPASQIDEERRVLTGSLHTVPNIHRLFKLHKYDWMARDLGTYNEEIVREFYASYAATLRGSIDKSQFLYGPSPDHTWALNTAEFDYKWDVVRSGAFMRNAQQREVVLLWLERHIAADVERVEWVSSPHLGTLECRSGIVIG
ncbi:hypothetical protein H5410_035765 [Solanum commersonii]|uniref:Uncharacterized protein n=1 Tax=Solanum commersonii TaxID=4109 RepID=A0A9J5Y2T7_SOLCO|nr:hypothetical protein H5410_035765 [Solanum commersonii]